MNEGKERFIVIPGPSSFKIATPSPVQPLRGLPEIFCLWAGEPNDLVCRNIKHLAEQIRGGNWASRGMLIEQCPCLH
jgi:hypothetical protein